MKALLAESNMRLSILKEICSGTATRESWAASRDDPNKQTKNRYLIGMRINNAKLILYTKGID
jgi:hypothetical protein